MSDDDATHSSSATGALGTYPVWDRPTRLLHWLNALLTLLVVCMGLLFMFRKDLDIEGGAAKLSIMNVHAVLGYVLALGVGVRIAWGFFGNHHVRWRAVLPGAGTFGEAAREGAAILGRRPWRHELGHGPLGRLSTTGMLSLFLLMFASGTLQAAVDLRHPPLWGVVSSYVAKPGADPARLSLKDDSSVDKAKAGRVIRVRKLAVRVHSLASYALMGLVLLHVAGVVLKEIRHGGGLLSSMITGRKVMERTPPDADRAAVTPKRELG